MTSYRQSAPLWKVMVGIIISIFLCTIVLWVFFDVTCSMFIERWLPIYPGAEIQEMTYTQLRPRANGETYMTLYTPDERNPVHLWHIQTERAIYEEDPNRGPAETDWRVIENPEGEGSIIYLYSRCGF